MNKRDTIRAWKDVDFRSSLEADVRHPAGGTELSDEALREVHGGSYFITIAGCGGGSNNSCEGDECKIE